MPTTNATIFLIFGVTGDLTWRKLVPALFNLYLGKHLPEQFMLLGLGRADEDDNSLRQRMEAGIRQFCRLPFTDEDWKQFMQAIHYQKIDFDDAAAYQNLAARLEQIEQGWKTKANQIFY